MQELQVLAYNIERIIKSSKEFKRYKIRVECVPIGIDKFAIKLYKNERKNSKSQDYFNKLVSKFLLKHKDEICNAINGNFKEE